MNFGKAIEKMKLGFMVSRNGWNGKGMFLRLITDSDYSIKGINKELCSFIGMKTADDKFIPWLASQADMLAEDWGVVAQIK